MTDKVLCVIVQEISMKTDYESDLAMIPFYDVLEALLNGQQAKIMRICLNYCLILNISILEAEGGHEVLNIVVFSVSVQTWNHFANSM